MLKIFQAQTEWEIEQVRGLWREFAEFLKSRFHARAEMPDFKEYLQNYEKEVANHLPGRFGPPAGCLLLAKDKDDPAGCVGLMDLGDGVCEMRRLFIRSEYRGLGIGKDLVEAVIEQGRNISYTSMRLNTNRRMPEAQKLYRSLGFEDIEPYEHFEVDGMVFMELKLT
jgi:ribosomal protein S18 acetylase RimI-like enzyme